MKYTQRTITPATEDADGICQSQTPGGAGNLTLNGALGTTLDYGRIITFTSAGNLSARTFTLTGTDIDGNTITETVTGPNAATVASTKFYKTITSIAIDAAAGAAVTIGTRNTTDSLVGQTIPLPVGVNDDNISIALQITGTAQVSIDWTSYEVMSSAASNATWTESTEFSNVTASKLATMPLCPAIRLRIESYTAGAVISYGINTKREG